MRSIDAPLFSLGGARGGDADFCKRDFVTEKDQRRCFVVVERAERTIGAGEIGVVVSFTGRQQVWNLAFGAASRGASGFGYHHRRGPWQTGHGLSELELFERRQLHTFGNLILKGEIEPALCFGQPAEPAVRECRVPLVPLAAHLVTELRAPG